MASKPPLSPPAPDMHNEFKKMDDDYCKVSFQTDPDGISGGSPERLWAKRLSPTELRFELQNSPFYADGVSYLDVVEAQGSLDSPGVLQYVKTVKPSGHSTYRLLVEKGKGAAHFARFWEMLERLGCTYEYSDEGMTLLYAVDVPSSTDLFKVYQILEEGEREGVWLFEEGHCGHPVIENQPQG